MKKEGDPNKFLVQKLNEFTEKFLSELANAPNRQARKAFAHKVLLTFLGNYSCFAKDEAKTKARELMFYLVTSINDIQKNETLEETIQELVDHMSCVMNAVEDKESVIRTIVFRLICLYSALAESDVIGAIKCHDLGKELSPNWGKTTPMKVTLSILEKREKDSKLPFNECESLEKYSFWIQNL